MQPPENSIQQLYAFQDSFTIYALESDDQNNFEKNLEIAFNKFPNKQIVDLLYPLINHKLVIMGIPDNNKNFLLGQLIVSKAMTHIYGMVINPIVHDITVSGESSNFNKIVNSMYYILINNYLGLFVHAEKRVIDDNMNLYNKVYAYFEHILIKNLKLFDLGEEKLKMFGVICKYFFNVYYLWFSPAAAYIDALEYNKVKDNPPINKKDLENYTQITDLYNVLVFFKLTTQTPNVLKYNLTNGIGVFAYLTIHNSLSSLIGSIILSKYSHPNFKKLNLSSQKADEIEAIVFNSYLMKASIDTVTLNKFHDAEVVKIKSKL